MKTVIVLLLAPWNTMLRGWVLVKLWAWFLAPYFHIPYLRIPVALGISTIVTLLTYQFRKQEDTEDAVSEAVFPVLISLLALGAGALYRMFL